MARPLPHAGARPAPEPRPRLTLRLSSFLSLLTRDVGDQLRALDRHREREFDFWHPLRDALRGYALEGLGRGEALEGIEAAATQSMLRRNQEVFERTADWIDRQEGRLVPPPSGVWRSPRGVFEVSVEPDLALDRRGAVEAVAIYGREAPRLRRDQAGAACRVMAEALEVDAVGVLDAETGQVLRTPTKLSDRVLDREVDLIEDEVLGA